VVIDAEDDSTPAGEVASLLLAAAAGEVPDLRATTPAYVALRRGGRLVREAWIDGPDLGWRLRVIALEPGTDADLVEVALTRDHRPVADPAALARELPNRERGLRGVRLTLGGLDERLAPSRMIAANLGFAAAAERFCARARVAPAEFSAKAGRIESFAARTLLIPLDGGPPMEPYRAGLLVPQEAVTPGLVETMALEMAAWLVRATGPDGRLPYKYWPSRGEHSKADNTIRQFMATVCLGRVAAVWGDPAAADAARRNLAFNLGRFLEVRDGVGMIAFDGSAKLGAAALAALAILEQEGAEGPHADVLEALIRGVDALWEADGSFRTFHYPAGRNDNQNFYPGEALLFLATLWRLTGDPGLHERLMASFRHHRAWHRAQRNPAFVPWHTQAYAKIHRARPDSELLAFVLEMNDWLLPMQQTAEAAGRPDLAGRFYDPEHPEYGPPHASSTGVYLEGLAEALDLALAAGDGQRARAYAAAVAAGVRNLRQLQFKDEADMFYVSRRERVAGALRTNPYDNTIRVDNVQHGLMALLKLIGSARDAAPS
jgi:hypothetical protein